MEENIDDSIIDREVLRLSSHIAEKKRELCLDKLPDVKQVFDEYCILSQEKSRSSVVAQWNKVKNCSAEHGKRLVFSQIDNSILALDFICSLLPSRHHNNHTRDRLETIWGLISTPNTNIQRVDSQALWSYGILCGLFSSIHLALEMVKIYSEKLKNRKVLISGISKFWCGFQKLNEIYRDYVGPAVIKTNLNSPTNLEEFARTIAMTNDEMKILGSLIYSLKEQVSSEKIKCAYGDGYHEGFIEIFNELGRNKRNLDVIIWENIFLYLCDQGGFSQDQVVGWLTDLYNSHYFSGERVAGRPYKSTKLSNQEFREMIKPQKGEHSSKMLINGTYIFFWSRK